MRLGLCLCGGGAKGAFQAGVVKGLKDRGIDRFDFISGTSIGSVNGYYIFTDNVEIMSKMWTNIENGLHKNINIVNNTVDNSPVIESLKILDNKSTNNNKFFVNYVKINNSRMEEVIVDISSLSKGEGIECIKYSSLLPMNPNKTLRFDQQFKKDMTEGMYDGYNLDGGLINNTLLKPLIEEKADKIILITMNKDYILPDEIKKYYNEDNIIIINPKREFESKDTLRFDEEFCTEIFNEGYELGSSINMNI